MGTYNNLTFNDPSLIKRNLQRRRITILDHLFDKGRQYHVLDYGCGNAELCNLLRPHLRSYTGFDVSQSYLAEAKQNIVESDLVQLHSDDSALPISQFEIIFCLEVFEHLKDQAIREILDDFARFLQPGGRIIVGVPNEIYLAALIRGSFRMTRKFGAFNARPTNIIRAAIGRPPTTKRRWSEAPLRLSYCCSHMGFDHRRLEKILIEKFELIKKFGSPFKTFPVLFNTEVYFILRKKS